MNVIQVVLTQETFDVPGAWLLLSRGCVDFGNRDPFAQNAVVIAIYVIIRGFHVSAICQPLHLLNVLRNSPDLRVRKSRRDYENSKKGNESTHVVSARVEYNPSSVILSVSALLGKFYRPRRTQTNTEEHRE